MSELHTPGTWMCIDGNIFSEGFTTETPIARVYKRKSPHVTLANARLIAAAPDLLDACIKTVEENGHLADGDNCTLIHLVRAIAKATGSVA